MRLLRTASLLFFFTSGLAAQAVRLTAAPKRVSVNSLGGLPASRASKGNSADMQGLCLDHQCGKFDKQLESGRCRSAYRCTKCRPPSAAQCGLALGQAMDTVTLALGSTRGEEKVPKGVHRLPVAWQQNDNSPLDLSLCGLDDMTAAKSRASALGNAQKFHVKLALAVSVWKVASERLSSDLVLDVVYHPSSMDVNAAGRYTGGGSCPRVTSGAFKINPTNVKPGSMVEYVSSVTVPWDRTDSITPDDFEIRLKCPGPLKCNLGLYRFCVRLVCPTTSADQLARIEYMAQRREQAPVARETIPQELLDEAALAAGPELTAEELAAKMLEEAAGPAPLPPPPRPLPVSRNVARAKGHRGEATSRRRTVVVAVAILAAVVIVGAGVVAAFVLRKKNN